MRKRIDVLWMNMTCRWLRYTYPFLFLFWTAIHLLYYIIPVGEDDRESSILQRKRKHTVLRSYVSFRL